MELTLLVIRTKDIRQLADFYSLLGLTFDYHKHGNSPYHYSTTIRNTVLEIYPLAKGQMEADRDLRLGFSLDNFEAIIEVLKDNGIMFSSEPMPTEYGFMAVVKDPDGRKIELYKR